MTAFTDDDYKHWLEVHGYVVVRLLDDTQLSAALENIFEYMPSWEDCCSPSPSRPRRRREWGKSRFPPSSATLSTGARSTLTSSASPSGSYGRTDNLLGHGQVGGKYAGTRDFDQDLHLDYGNNMLVVPNPDDEAFHVPALLYYTNVTVDLGPTYVVPQEWTRDDPLVPRHRSRREFPNCTSTRFP